MSDKTILVIDDSSTIRKLADTYLSPVGYRVILAGTAEDGLRLVGEVKPDLILLDHQLPGTTGFEVCRQLCASPEHCTIPVVISSTLRKKAYVEYTDQPNVVDMLPKPYTAELLTTTIANALDTGSLIVTSQSEGTAVPEVIDAVADGDLAGTFKTFSLRELLDFLNHGKKLGVLEVEAEHARVSFYLDNGRIQGISATGINIDDLTRYLPDGLQNLAPVLKMTVAGRGCADTDGIVQLLDQKVLDTRLMTRLLRFQASTLVLHCFTRALGAFRFDTCRAIPSIHRKLPLDISLLALLVEGAHHCDESQLPSEPGQVYQRRVVRGQNLDRAGLSAQHMNILGQLSEPRSVSDLAAKLEWEELEVRRVLYGLTLAELIDTQVQAQTRQFVLFEPNAEDAQKLRATLPNYSRRFPGKVVRDGLALQLVLKRSHPDVLVFDVSCEESQRIVRELLTRKKINLEGVRRVGVLQEPTTEDDAFWSQWPEKIGVSLDATLTRPYSAPQLIDMLEQLFLASPDPAPVSLPVEDAAPTDEPVPTGAT